MRKLFPAILAALLLLPAAAVSAQGLHSKFQATFISPLGTNGRQAPLYTNDFSLNLLAGVSKNERKIAVAGWANIILNNAENLQIAGLVNYTGNNARGFQFAGLANIVRGELEGFQFGGLVNYAASVDRLQSAGLANISTCDVEGVQIGGLLNYAGGNVDGVQIGSLINIARNVKGTQISGLVNIAESNDYPIGIVNIIKKGEMGVAAGYDELGTASLTFRSGGRVTYGILGVGYNFNTDKKRDATSIVGGLGAHINITPAFRLNNELSMTSFSAFTGGCDEDGNDNIHTYKAGYSLLPAYRTGHFEIFAGPSINYIQTNNPDMYSLLPENTLWDKTKGAKVQQLYIGWQVGVQFIF